MIIARCLLSLLFGFCKTVGTDKRCVWGCNDQFFLPFLLFAQFLQQTSLHPILENFIHLLIAQEMASFSLLSFLGKFLD